MKNVLLLLLLFFYTLPALSQSGDTDYSAIDNRARNTPYNGDLKQLVSELTTDCTSQIEEARAIFVWITHNISYDYKAYNKGKGKPFRCKGKNCNEKLIKWENKHIERTLRKKKAVCSGYSALFKRMCDYAGIQSSVISGYTKDKPSQVGRMGELDHAWNAIKIDDNYYYLDATWASGFCTVDKKGKLDYFVRKFKEYYWLTPIDKFSRNHYPDEEFWADLAVPEVVYKNTPYIKNTYISSMEIISPSTGIINIKKGDTLQFKIKFKKPTEHLQINSNINRNPNVWKQKGDTMVLNEHALKKQKYIDFKYIDGIYYFNHIVESEKLRYIEILFDYKMLVKFKCTNSIDDKL